MDDDKSAQDSSLTQNSALRMKPSGRRLSTLETRSGTWTLGKTIGVGATSKVKLAKNHETGEQIAIKIVFRPSKDESQTTADAEHAKNSAEIRTAREAAILKLVNHPYICNLRDVVKTEHHWYLLLDYVEGSQLLDYIISHGRLKEKQARKFARQITSALDYCHRNSIVHRDICIENIMVSKTGDIKLVDFSLSNLFSPQSQLNTFCGGSYFAAPEILEANPYIGPEVDIWSFGVVLYTLVCGRVPFDDQSLAGLHHKIKYSFVEYPKWLSADCKDIISKMLTTDPKQRASLAELKHHPWMTKGCNGPPESYLSYRDPLQLPLDPEVMDNMHSFGFGTPDHITEELTKVLLSVDYQKSVSKAQLKATSDTPQTTRNRRTFGFFKPKGSAGRNAPVNTFEGKAEFGKSPITAPSPLISIYYLAREKLDRERTESEPRALYKANSRDPISQKEAHISFSSLNIDGNLNHQPNFSTSQSTGDGCFSGMLMGLCSLRSAHRRRTQRHVAFKSEHQVEPLATSSTSGSEKSVKMASLR